MPWGTFLFLLVVFAVATPFFRFFGLVSFGIIDADAVTAMANIMSRDNKPRIVVLISLGVFALFNLLRSKTGRFQINGLLGWLILFYLVWAALSIIWSIDTRFTLKRVGILLILSVSALYVADRFSVQEIIALVFFICAVAILGGLVTNFMTHNFLPFNSSWRFGGNMHPIMQGWHLGLLLLSVFALSQKAEKNSAVYLCIAFIAFLLLVLTRSRGPFIACFIGSSVYWGMTTSKRYKGVLFFLGIITFGCLMYLILGSGFMSFGGKALTLGRFGQIETTTTLTGRTPLWTEVMILVNQRPFVGYGYDSFLFELIEMTGGGFSSAHSGYMTTLGGLGYIGGVLLVLILFLSVKMSIGLARRNPEYAFVAAILVWLIINLILEDQILTRPFFPVFVWMILLARLGFRREES
jgi:exopolysaccharide production protein ExoQ